MVTLLSDTKNKGFVRKFTANKDLRGKLSQTHLTVNTGLDRCPDHAQNGHGLGRYLHFNLKTINLPKLIRENNEGVR